MIIVTTWIVISVIKTLVILPTKALFVWDPYCNLTLVQDFKNQKLPNRSLLNRWKITDRENTGIMVKITAFWYNVLITIYAYMGTLAWGVVLYTNVVIFKISVGVPTLFIYLIEEGSHWLLAPLIYAKIGVLCWKTKIKNLLRWTKNSVHSRVVWGSNYKRQIHYFMGDSRTYKICFILFVMSYTRLSYCEAQNFATSVVTQLAALMPCYLLWQTFTYFYKTLEVSKNTTQVTSFWQRTYLVFWGIEITLFLIFVFLFFISPEAPKMVIGQTLNLKVIAVSTKSIVGIFLSVLAILACNLFLLIEKNYQNRLITAPVLLLVLYQYTQILLDEYLFFIYNCAQWSALVETFNYEGVLCGDAKRIVLGSPQTEILLYLENYNYGITQKTNEELFAQMVFSLLWFLRFWHVALIVIMFVFFLLKWITRGDISYEALAMNVTNTAILFWFNMTYLLVYVKVVGKEHIGISPRMYHMDDIQNMCVEVLVEVLEVLGI